MLISVLAALLVVYVAATAVRMYARKYYLFLPNYLVSAVALPHPPGTRHIFVLFTDHFEPHYDAARVVRWAGRYRALASRHQDSSGRRPQHTFFYPGEQVVPSILETLRGLVADGLGEVELHYHHDFDTARTFRPKLLEAINAFQRHGFLKTVDGATHFAFIHGNSGLDNSNGDRFCGVDDEIALLREVGAFADFTFPSVYEDSQPPFVDTIYAARDDRQPKSYKHRLPVSALDDGSADLMIFQGPLIFTPSLKVSRLFLDLDDGDIHPAMPASAHRVDRWVRANVHVPERPEWIFIKLFAHSISSAPETDAVLGDGYEAALTRLERAYDDGVRYKLHYVTAREAYNLARAAAAGVNGEPELYFDTPIPPYAADRPRAAGPPDTDDGPAVTSTP